MSCCCLEFRLRRLSIGEFEALEVVDTGRTYNGKCVWEVDIALSDGATPTKCYLWWIGLPKGWVVTTTAEGVTPLNIVMEGTHGVDADCPDNTATSWTVFVPYNEVFDNTVFTLCPTEICDCLTGTITVTVNEG